MYWPDLAGVHREETVEEDKNTDQGGGDQHAGVPAQPRKVQTDFLTKVTPARETERQRDSEVRIHQQTELIKAGGVYLQWSWVCR